MDEDIMAVCKIVDLPTGSIDSCLIWSSLELSMGHSSEDEDDTDFSESELDEYEDKFYEEMKNGKHKVKISDEVFKCPFCIGKKKTYFIYKDILQHAYGVGKGSHSRGVRHQANHLALAKYLEKDLAPLGIHSLSMTGRETPAMRESEVLFVWPWVGIIVNVLTERAGDTYTELHKNKLLEYLAEKGFNPVKVHTLSSHKGYTGYAVVEFNKDWSGFYNAISMEKYFAADHRGKKDWHSKIDSGSRVYGWVARDDDYNFGDPVGNLLRIYGDLKTCAEIVAEEKLRTSKFVENLTNVIESKNELMKDVECKLDETKRSLKSLVDGNDGQHPAFKEDLHIYHSLYTELVAQISSLEISIDNISEENSDMNKSTFPPGCPQSQSLTGKAPSAKRDDEELFVWPWVGVIVNLPTEWVGDRHVGVNKKLKEQLTEKGFNPVKVHFFLSPEGNTANAIVEFNKDWSGFCNAMSTEKYFETDHRGKEQWRSKKDSGSCIYGWVARSSDYNSGDSIGDHLRKTCDLKTCADIVADEECKTRQLVTYLGNVIESKSKQLEEIESKLNEANLSFKRLMNQNNRLHQTLNEGKGNAFKGKYLKTDKEDDKIKLGYKSSWKHEHKGKAKGEGSSSKEFHCNHCMASGHISDYCWKLHPELRPKEVPIAKAPAPAPVPLKAPATAPPPTPVKAPPTPVKAPPSPVKAPPAPVILLPPVMVTECPRLCGGRCKLHSRPNHCMRVCNTCCQRCKCVPPGTFGNKDMCGKCYTEMKTHGDKPKCP
ncbi:hypothetical protein GIB67_004732 [Kingdonia uniflora]|uniref:Uncharacterized protein n=1 Tax=Kingdonia uniflora TaxID=39325 RepID=A0A7J7P5T1_9MAGN|nr:hypothetical protein GIB67_004732 [Kingdonia uniflora]